MSDILTNFELTRWDRKHTEIVVKKNWVFRLGEERKLRLKLKSLEKQRNLPIETNVFGMNWISGKDEKFMVVETTFLGEQAYC